MEYKLINGCFSDEAAIYRLLSFTLIVLRLLLLPLIFYERAPV